jgi:hypothetical protein
VGGTIAFGNYNGSPIQWYILDDDTANHRVMLLAMNILEKRAYNTSLSSITWEKSTIRSWLNGYDSTYNTYGTDYTSDNFINKAFTITERAKIVASIYLLQSNRSTPRGALFNSIRLTLTNIFIQFKFPSGIIRHEIKASFCSNLNVYLTGISLPSNVLKRNFEIWSKMHSSLFDPLSVLPTMDSIFITSPKVLITNLTISVPGSG